MMLLVLVGLVGVGVVEVGSVCICSGRRGEVAADVLVEREVTLSD
jgi:hypothetical protein